VDGSVGVGPGMTGGGAADFAGVTEAKGLGDRLGMSRLSTMMRELEGLKIGDTVTSNFGAGFSFANRFGGQSSGRGD
jgi:exocyst complex component 5